MCTKFLGDGLCCGEDCYDLPPTAEDDEKFSISMFIREEVERQGFDLGTEDGRLRLAWMAAAWRYAQWQWHGYPRAARVVRERPNPTPNQPNNNLTTA